MLEDLGSTNGTYANGVRLIKPTVVQRHDRITLGLTCGFPWPAWATGPAAAPAAAIPTPGPRVIRIGRAADNDVVLDSPAVSANHARIVKQGGRTILEDLGSTNGTAVGRPENRISRAPITPSDIVYFGILQVRAARLLGESPQAVEESHTTIPMLEARTVVFGRDPSCDEVLDAPSISWRHASITNGGGLPLLKDLGSTNGTFLNGRRVIAPVPVKPGDVIHLGTYALRLGGNGKLEEAR